MQFDAAGCQTQPSRKKPAWVLAEVLRLAAHLQTPRAIAHNFNRLHGQRMTVGKTWVHARCRENAEFIAAMRRGMRGKPPRIVPAKLEWGINLTLTCTSDGNQHPTFAIIDQVRGPCCASRYSHANALGLCCPSSMRPALNMACPRRCVLTTRPSSPVGCGPRSSSSRASSASALIRAAPGRTGESSGCLAT